MDTFNGIVSVGKTASLGARCGEVRWPEGWGRTLAPLF